jgi:P-type Cu+ transporter
MAQTFKDPVCGMEVTPETAAGKSEYQGRTYYFCSIADKETFDKKPEKYVMQEQDNPR